MYEIAIFVVGTIVGSIIKDFVKGISNSYIERFAGTLLRQLRFRTKVLQSISGYFKIGHRKTSLFVIDGDGVRCFEPATMVAVYRDGTPDSPDDVSDAILCVERGMEIARANGSQKVWDGIGVGLSRYDILRTADETKLACNIDFFKSRYAAFQATVVKIGTEEKSDPNSLYQKYLSGRSPEDFVPFLARHVGIVAAVVTKDNYVVMVKRSKRTAVRQDNFDISIVEGIEPIKDAEITGNVNTVNIFHSVQRGCEEELGFCPTISEIKMLGFAVDMDFYQFNFIALIMASKSYEDIATLRNSRAVDGWETEIFPLENSIVPVLEFIAENKMWGFAAITLYWSLLQQNVRVTVDAKAGQIVQAEVTSQSVRTQ
jgi:hypothetical protein